MERDLWDKVFFAMKDERLGLSDNGINLLTNAAMGVIEESITELERENARLRELVEAFGLLGKVVASYMEDIEGIPVPLGNPSTISRIPMVPFPEIKAEDVRKRIEELEEERSGHSK